MDAMNMSFENESFDVVFDKGTLDAILCGNNSFDNARKMISGVFRILKPNGLDYYIYFIYNFYI